MKKRVDIGLVVAMAWLAAAVGVTVVLGPQLGMRGWVWLGLHHVLCAVGCVHEIWRAWQRRNGPDNEEDNGPTMI